MDESEIKINRRREFGKLNANEQIGPVDQFRHTVPEEEEESKN